MILYRRSFLNAVDLLKTLLAERVLLFTNCLTVWLGSPKRGRDVCSPDSPSKTDLLDDNLLVNPIPDPGTRSPVSTINSDGLKLFRL